MTYPESEASTKQRILRRIHEGELRMRPKWHFLLKTALIFIGGVILALALLYVASFVIFVLRQTGAVYVPGFGFHGLVQFLLATPWRLLVLGAAFLVVLEILVRRFAFAYRTPLLYSLVVILLFMIGGSYVVARTGMHEAIFQRAQEKPGRAIRIMGAMHQEYGLRELKQIHPGAVSSVSDDGFIMLNPRREQVAVQVSERTRLQPANLVFERGQHVVVWGEREGETIQARGIKRVIGPWPTPGPGREGTMLRHLKYRGR